MVTAKVGCQNSHEDTKLFLLINQKGIAFHKKRFFILSLKLLFFFGRVRESLNKEY